jgi:hypothetical protein
MSKEKSAKQLGSPTSKVSPPFASGAIFSAQRSLLGSLSNALVVHVALSSSSLSSNKLSHHLILLSDPIIAGHMLIPLSSGSKLSAVVVGFPHNQVKFFENVLGRGFRVFVARNFLLL